MRNLKLCLLLSLVSFFLLPKPGWAEFTFVPKLGKVGLASGGCGAPEYKVKSCVGHRIDYVEYNTNLAIAYGTIQMKFDDDFVKSYGRSFFWLGYRIDFDRLLQFMGKEEPIFILSSLFLTLYPLVYGRESFETKGYKYEAQLGRETAVEIGWRFNETWDLFIALSHKHSRAFFSADQLWR